MSINKKTAKAHYINGFNMEPYICGSSAPVVATTEPFAAAKRVLHQCPRTRQPARGQQQYLEYLAEGDTQNHRSFYQYANEPGIECLVNTPDPFEVAMHEVDPDDDNGASVPWHSHNYGGDIKAGAPSRQLLSEVPLHQESRLISKRGEACGQPFVRSRVRPRSSISQYVPSVLTYTLEAQPTSTPAIGVAEDDTEEEVQPPPQRRHRREVCTVGVESCNQDSEPLTQPFLRDTASPAAARAVTSSIVPGRETVAISPQHHGDVSRIVAANETQIIAVAPSRGLSSSPILAPSSDLNLALSSPGKHVVSVYYAWNGRRVSLQYQPEGCFSALWGEVFRRIGMYDPDIFSRYRLVHCGKELVYPQEHSQLAGNRGNITRYPFSPCRAQCRFFTDDDDMLHTWEQRTPTASATASLVSRMSHMSVEETQPKLRVMDVLVGRGADADDATAPKHINVTKGKNTLFVLEPRF